MPPLDRNPGWHFHDPHDILHEMPYTMHWKAAATDVCDISILFGPRPHMAATNDDCRACGRQGRGSKVANMDAKVPARTTQKDGSAKFSVPASAWLRQRIASTGPWLPYAPWWPILCTTGLRHRTAATSASSSKTWQRVDVTGDGSSAV